MLVMSGEREDVKPHPALADPLVNAGRRQSALSKRGRSKLCVLKVF
jgi:hypothetical protein